MWALADAAGRGKVVASVGPSLVTILRWGLWWGLSSAKLPGKSICGQHIIVQQSSATLINNLDGVG